MSLSELQTEFEAATDDAGTFAQTHVKLVPQYLREHAVSLADRPYVTARSVDGELRTLSFAELDLLSARLAGWLTSELGLRAGDAVGFAAVNDLTCVVGLFALLRSGIRALVVSPQDPPQRALQQLGQLSIGVALASRTDLALPLRGVTLPKLDELDPRLAAPGHECAASDVALYFGTSGSTAASKLVSQAHLNLASNAEAMRRHHGLEPGDRVLACLPLHHVNCLHLTVIGAFLAGAHLHLASRFDIFEYPRLLEDFRPKLASVVPSILEALLATWRRPHLPSNFAYFVSAASPLRAQTASAVHTRLGVRVLQGYGLTETTNFSTTMPRGLDSASYDALALKAEIPSIGVAVYGNSVTVLDADGRRLDAGAVGELCVRGQNVMIEYATNAAATAEAFRGGWFHTQDLGFYRSHAGQHYFFLTGRTKNIAKVGGESVSLEEMESLLQSVPGIEDAACAAFPDKLFGDVIIAAAVWRDGTVAPNWSAALEAGFQPALHPQQVVRLSEIPRTATGKIRRPELSAILASRTGR